MTAKQAEEWDYECAKQGWTIFGARVRVYLERMWAAEKELAAMKAVGA